MPPIRLNEAARAALLSYSWPGNIRQLKNVAETMSVTEDTREITPEILSQYINFQTGTYAKSTVSGGHKAIEPTEPNVRLETDTNTILQMILTLRHDIEQLKSEVAQLKKGQWCQSTMCLTTPQTCWPIMSTLPTLLTKSLTMPKRLLTTFPVHPSNNCTLAHQERCGT